MPRKSLTVVVFVLLLHLSWFVPSPVLAKNSNSLQVKGSDTMVNLVQAWAEEYMKIQPEAFIAVTGGGSGTGLAALINKTCDIAVSSRQIKEQERGLAGKKGVTPTEYKVALDGLAVVVNPANPISQLTLEQLADIFTGTIKNWKELGGEDLNIVILSREVNSGTHVYFKEYVLRKNDPKSMAEFSPDALMMPSSQAIADEVKNNRSAIGYYGMGYIGKDHKAVSVAKAEGSPYVFPTVDHVIAGDYPISRPLFFYVNGQGNGDVEKFMDFILSPEGQAIVTQVDFVPIR